MFLFDEYACSSEKNEGYSERNLFREAYCTEKASSLMKMWIYVQPMHFPKASLLSAVYFHYTNLSFVGLLCATKKNFKTACRLPMKSEERLFSCGYNKTEPDC